MRIKIKAEKIIVRGEQKRKITEIKALSYAELPAEYTAHKTEYISLAEKDLNYRNPDKTQTSHVQSKGYLRINEIIEEATFQECLKNIRRCGHRLQEINARLKKENVNWHEKETFVI